MEGLLQGKEPFYLGRGENWRAVVHIDDVVDLFALLLQEALLGGGKAQWGREGFYFGASHEVVWKDVAETIARLGREQKWLPEASHAVSFNAEQVGSLSPKSPGMALYLYGSNSRASADRARLYLGWQPRAPNFWEALPGDLEELVARYKKKLNA